MWLTSCPKQDLPNKAALLTCYITSKLFQYLLFADLCSPVAFSSSGPQLCPVDASTNIGTCPDAQAGQQCFDDGRQLQCQQSDAVLSLMLRRKVCAATHKLTV